MAASVAQKAVKRLGDLSRFLAAPGVWVVMVLLSAVVVVSGCQPPPVSPARVAPSIVWHACDGEDAAWVSSRCGRYYPYATAANTAHRSAFIAFAVLTPPQAPAEAQPVVFMAGGPGEGGNSQGIKLERWRYWLLDNPIQRPLIVWDSLGNQGAWGYFECEAYRLWSLNQLMHTAPPATKSEEREQLQRCVMRWQTQLAGYRLSSLNSQQNARDILGALQALGYSRWHVMSVSYGSRVAEWLAALAPTQTRSLLLDSPYSWRTQTPAHHQQFWWQGLERFFSQCDKQADCAGARPMSAIFDAAIERLDQQPMTVRFELDGYHQSAAVNGDIFAHLLFTLLYNPATYPQAAQLLQEVAAGEPLASPNALGHILASSYSQAANPWLYWLTQCNDNTVAADRALNGALPVPLKWQRFLQASTQNAVCALAGASAGKPRAPVAVRTLPVLVLSGLLDPVTPAMAAQKVAQQYDGGVLLQAPNAGHGLLLSEVCSNTWLHDYWHAPASTLQHIMAAGHLRANKVTTAKPELAKLSALPSRAPKAVLLGACNVRTVPERATP